METVTMFKTASGRLFNEEADAVKWECLCVDVENVMRPLGEKPADPHGNFANGDGFIQHDLSLRDRLSRALVQVAKAYKSGFGQWGGVDHSSDTSVNGIVGRILSDSDLTIVYAAWCRLMCVASLGREWGQPYYAYHPDEGKHTLLRDNGRHNNG